jgi:hypothetical protein
VTAQLSARVTGPVTITASVAAPAGTSGTDLRTNLFVIPSDLRGGIFVGS